MQWYRAYAGMSADPKFKVIATMAQTERVIALAVWLAMLEHACTHDGSIHDLSPLDVGCALDVPADIVTRVMQAFSEKGMISGSHVTAWKRRQFLSDSSTERTRNYRFRKRNVHVTACDGEVTPPEQNRTEHIRTEKKVERAPSAAPTRGSRFPFEKLPEPWMQFCQETRLDLDPSATFDRCRDYWIAQPGQRGVKRDWDATWRNWVRNERKRDNGQKPDLQRRRDLAKAFLDLPDSGAVSGGAERDQTAAGETVSSVPVEPRRRH